MIVSFNLFGRRILIKLIAMKLPDNVTEGIESRCEDGLHVGFFDYDKIEWEYLTEVEIPMLQDQFGLSDFYLFDSGRANGKMRGYHAICLDKLPIGEWYRIIKHSSCEWAFKDAPHSFSEYKSWVLRKQAKAGRKKPRYLCTMKSPFANHQQSLAHAIFLMEHYSVPVNLNNDDGSKTMSMCEYRTYSKKRGE